MAYPVEQRLAAQADGVEAFAAKCDIIGVDRAAEWYNGLQDAINAIGEFPGSHPLARESEAVPGLRQKLYGKGRDVWRIVFHVRHDVVWVLRIRHAAQETLMPEEMELPQP